MRFVCESCQARYVVPDDRIRGRTLKVRCKKCGNLILIKGPTESRTGASETPLPVAAASTDAQDAIRDRADELTQVVDAAAQRKLREQWQKTAASSGAGSDPSGEEQLEWHVILPAGQLGPLALSALIQKMVSGEMPPRSYVWRDGMADWKRAEQVPEVARWLPAARPSSPPPASPASGVDRPSGQTKPGIGAVAGHGDEELADRFFESSPASTGSTPGPQSSRDSLAGVASSPELTASKPGELTRFFITQAHVTQGRSPWAVAIFGLAVAVLLVGGVLGLAQLGVPVPLVSAEPGARPKIFSGSQTDPHVRDLLLGHPKPASTPGGGAGPRPSSQGRVDTGTGQEQGPLAKRAEQHVDQLGKSDKDQLSRLYASQDLSNLKIRPGQAALPVLDRPDAPLTPEQVSRTVAKFQTGYTRCIDGELKRNPNFQGGKIRIVTTIMSSGLVRQAQIVSDDQRLQRSVAEGQLGSCLSEQTRRMVFPSFQGEPFDAEIPLVLSSAL